ncbi:MAG: bacterioferritin [candidate division KSB1 bacterium]|nr:bacterioferritin [candidate division KSB1 bacterium]MDZ7338272.1 bacterioferritin [candidate division KSB1 bacterium]MDZ7386251.1 bacterioferritin [candidate division KSB1 bacterium]MDZ7393263.1 bacterioferritin [candidate division KSB1 bacterium]MDZ7412349.1 bacterioferritin [candidate division KSB1 bacterium]
MKGDEKMIASLNARLAEELTAISQYMVHSEMNDDWGYQKLHEAIEKRAIEEMRHAEKLIGRILFLEGTPIVSKLNPMHIGAEVEKQHQNDWQAEKGAIDGYRESIKLAGDIGDFGTRELLESILKDEEAHIDWIESQLDQIKQVGIENYLADKIG